MRRSTLLVIGIFLLAASVYGQQKSRVAVLPFSAVETSATEARVVTSLFETALVKTGVYNVIEQNQINEILEAQAFSLSGCTDDSCAVEVGKLLAAELIVLGELSKVGGRYIANAKIIDVGLGKNVNADSVSAGTIAEMTDQGVTLLAYKLAGLTYSEGGGDRIADAFGEIYVSTDPDGAEIYINGMRRGTSPLVVDKVPLGNIRVTARKENLVAEKTIELETADLIELSLKLTVSLGRLFIKSPEKGVEVFLDENSLGPLGSGLFKDIPAGTHSLTLKGDGLLWEDKVVLEPEKTTSVEAYPRPVGLVTYELPEGAQCEVSGPGGSVQLSGMGITYLTAGKYRAVVKSEGYLPYESEFEVHRGGQMRFVPPLEYTEEYRLVVEARQLQEAETSFTEALDYLEGRLKRYEGTLDERISELEAARDVTNKIECSGFDLPELKARSVELTFLAIGNRMEELQALKAAADKRTKSKNVARWTAFGIGVGGITMAVILNSLGQQQYQEYLSAQTTDVSEALHEQLVRNTVFSTVGGITGGVSMVIGLSLMAPAAGPGDYTAEITSLAEERAALEGGVR